MKNSLDSAVGAKIGDDALKVVYRFLLLALAVLAALSIAKGFQNALGSSQDFQWSPTRLLMAGENPYQVSLDGNKNGALILTQGPNYLHLLYILFIPLALLDWNTVKPVWALVNVVLGFSCVYFIAHSGSKITGGRLWAVLFIFLCSTPFRNTISNGQQALLILLFSYLGWSMRPMLSAAPFFGASYVKYSFAPPIMLWLLLEKNVRLILLSFLFLAIGWLLFSAIVGINPIETAFQPLQVSAKEVGIGTADIMSIGKVLEWDKHVFRGIGYVAGLVLAAALTLYLRFFCRRLESEDIFAALALISLMSFFHLAYDFVFLLPLFCRSFSLAFWRRLVVYAGIGYFWFGLRFFMTGDGPHGFLTPINFIVVVLMFFAFTSSKAGEAALPERA